MIPLRVKYHRFLLKYVHKQPDVLNLTCLLIFIHSEKDTCVHCLHSDVLFLRKCTKSVGRQICLASDEGHYLYFNLDVLSCCY